MKTAHNVKLLNGSKQEVSYTGVETVTMPGTDGQGKVFTAGTPIDALDISPDFSGGDMPLEAPEGYVVRSAIIKKPEGAEQVIAKGQTVAGIAGEYVTPGRAKEIILDFSAGLEADYLPQLTGTTALDDTYGYFIRVEGGTPLTVGDTYLVAWDGTAYTCAAQDASALMDGAVCVGNATAFGLTGSDEPFVAAYLQGGFSVVALTDTEPTEHTVRIYQVSEDQTVTAEGDERWSEVTVKKPEGLVPENIVKDVEIAGVVGAFEAADTAGLIDGTISEISDATVKSVRNGMFSDCQNLSTVSFPMCETVGGNAFYSCSSLNSVYLPMCDKIGYRAFYNCSMLADYVFSDTIQAIGSQAFYGTPIQKFEQGVAYLNNAAFSTSRTTLVSATVFREGTTLITDHAFSGNSYVVSVAGSEVVRIGSAAFSECRKLKKVSFPVCESIGPYAFSQCSSLNTIDAPACKYVGYGAFYNAYKLQSISFPECRTIYNYAFNACTSLSTAYLPKCDTIGMCAFSGCTRLSSVVFSDNLASVGYSAFYGTPILNSFTDGICYLNNVVLSAKSFPKDVQLRSGTTLIAPYAFGNNSTITFSVHGSEVTEIGEAAFSYCKSMSYASFPACKGIGGRAFYYCINLKSVDFPLCETIGTSAFAYCSNLFSINFPVCTTVFNGAFIGDSYITAMDLPECLVISNYAFSGCSRLSVARADRCETIGSWAFMNCSNLASLYLLGSSIPYIGNGALNNTKVVGSSPSGKIFVRASMLSGFIADENWSIYSAALSGLTDTDVKSLGGIT